MIINHLIQLHRLLAGILLEFLQPIELPSPKKENFSDKLAFKHVAQIMDALVMAFCVRLIEK